MLHLGGPAASFLGYAKAGLLQIDTSGPILDETFRVLRDKFGWSGEMMFFTRATLEQTSNRVAPTEILNVISFDPPDNRILECAATAKSDYIVSEDKDLLRLVEYKGTKIVTVRDFINQALQEGRGR
jgi:predicted nucleic acid-binding protein